MSRNEVVKDFSKGGRVVRNINVEITTSFLNLLSHNCAVKMLCMGYTTRTNAHYTFHYYSALKCLYHTVADWKWLDSHIAGEIAV